LFAGNKQRLATTNDNPGIALIALQKKPGGGKMRIFLESEEFWFEDFKVDNLTQAISELKTLYRNCKECFKEDGIVRKIGVIIE
jgi:hypothetical protein